MCSTQPMSVLLDFRHRDASMPPPSLDLKFGAFIIWEKVLVWLAENNYAHTLSLLNHRNLGPTSLCS